MSAIGSAHRLLRHFYRSVTYASYSMSASVSGPQVRSASSHTQDFKKHFSTAGITSSESDVSNVTMETDNQMSRNSAMDLILNENNTKFRSEGIAETEELNITRIRKLKTVEDVIFAVQNCNHFPVLISAVLQITMIFNESSDEEKIHIQSFLLNNPNTRRTVQILEKKLQTMRCERVNELVLALNHLPHGLFNFNLELVSEKLLSCMETAPIYMILNVIGSCTRKNGPNWPKKTELIEKGKSVLSLREHEIVNVNQILETMKVLRKSTTFQLLLKKVSNFVQNMTQFQLLQLLEILAEEGVRNLTLIRSIIFHLQVTMDKVEFSPYTYSRLLNSLAKLSVMDENIMQQISQDIERNLPSLKTKGKPTVISSVSHSFVHLRWLSQGVLDSVLMDVEKMPAAKLAQVIYAVANLYHWPTHHKKKLVSAIEQLGSFTSTTLKPGQLVKLVWSLCVLELAKPQHVSAVLQKDFVELIGKDGTVLQKVNLQNIDCEARLAMTNYDGPLLNSQLCERLKRNNRKQSLVNSVEATLKEMGVVFNTGISLPEGHNIDAEVFIDKVGNLATNKSLDRSEDLQKVALQVLSFHDVTMPTLLELGYIKLMRRHLQLMGYKVIMVPYYVWSQKSKVQEQADYLKHLCKEHV